MAPTTLIAMIAAIIAGGMIIAVAVVFAVSKLKERKAAQAGTPANPAPANPAPANPVPANSAPNFPTRRTLVNVEILKSLDRDIAKADEAAKQLKEKQDAYAAATLAVSDAVKAGKPEEIKAAEDKASKAKAAMTKAAKAVEKAAPKKTAALERRSEICSIIADEVVKYCSAKKD